MSRTHGAELPESPSPKLLEGEAPAGLWEGLASQVESLGYEVLRMPDSDAIRGANGMTDYETRQVLVRTDMDPAAQVKTLAHELGHVRLHGPDQKDARQHRGIGEVEAESVALMIAAAHGMDTSDYTIPYVAGWAANVDGTDPVQVIRDTGEKVRRTATEVIDGQRVCHVYATREICDDVCTTCDDPLTGDETGRCHRCEHGDDDTGEVQ